LSIPEAIAVLGKDPEELRSLNHLKRCSSLQAHFKLELSIYLKKKKGFTKFRKRCHREELRRSCTSTINSLQNLCSIEHSTDMELSTLEHQQLIWRKK